VNLSKALGVLGFPLILIAVGTLLYLVYRPFIYDAVIIHLQDWARLRSNNYRTFLKTRYRITATEAIVLWRLIREERFKEKYGTLQTMASGVHLLYLVGVLALPFGIWNLTSDRTALGCSLIGLSIIFLTGAFLQDKHYESLELYFLKTIPMQELDAIVEQTGLVASIHQGTGTNT